MTRKLFLFAFSILLFTQVMKAQEVKIRPLHPPSSGINIATKSEVHHAPLYASLEQSAAGEKWAISVKSISSHEHGSAKVQMIKDSKLPAKINSFKPSDGVESYSRAVYPEIGKNYEANWSIESTPPDNTMAISNAGIVVTANNDGIEYYSASGSFLYFDYWSDFFNDNTLNASLFDPKVIYDSGSDRYVLIVLHGSNANTSKVLVCFSKTNNPVNGWWVYKLTGNPLGNNGWFDYPALGVSNNEIYITGNLFKGNSYDQPLVYQIPKAAGYAGQSLDWQYWSDLTASSIEPFSLVPASFGQQGNYGPGIYFVSNESSGDSRIILWDLTDDMSGSPQMNGYTINTEAYSPAANALQSGTSDQLDNGDCRVQSAFYLNGIVHFVFHSDIGEGWNGINYNRLNVANSTNESHMYGLQGSYDYSYPAVASFATSNTDPTVMIAFLRSSENSYPEVRVTNCDRDFTWSPSTQVKEGETYVDFLSDEVERWGDYTGICRKHNSPDPRIWLAGCYGADINSQSAFNTYKTWVAEIKSGETVSVAEPEIAEEVKVFPNPTYNLFNIRFTTDGLTPVQIDLLDAHGVIIRTLYHDTPKQGENKLTFNQDALTPGTYILSIHSGTQILKNEKLVIVR